MIDKILEIHAYGDHILYDMASVCPFMCPAQTLLVIAVLSEPHERHLPLKVHLHMSFVLRNAITG